MIAGRPSTSSAGEFYQIRQVGTADFPHRQAFVHQRGDRHLPAGARRAETLRIRHTQVGEEHLVEVRGTGHLMDRLLLQGRKPAAPGEWRLKGTLRSPRLRAQET